MKQLITLLYLAFTVFSFAQVKNESTLSIDEVMQGENFVGYLPTNISWSDNSKNIYFSWNPDNDTIRSTYQVDITSNKIDKLSFNDHKQKTNTGDYTKDGLWKVYQKNGDIFLMNAKTYKIEQITNTVNRESNPQFSGDNKSIIYQSENNVFQWHIANGTTVQLTNFESGSKKTTQHETAQAKWLEDDQLELFDILGQRKFLLI